MTFLAWTAYPYGAWRFGAALGLLAFMSIFLRVGWFENQLSFTPILGLLALLGLVGFLSYLVLQRFDELIVGRTTTSIRELMIYTGIVVLLCALLMSSVLKSFGPRGP